jgi:hypothetical protein
MNFTEHLFTAQDEPVKTNEDFWIWFRKHEKALHQVVKENGDVKKDFFERISPKLDELKAGFFFLTGMTDSDTVELVIAADGEVKNIVFVEELINTAPEIQGWKFTALKPAVDIKGLCIEMNGYKFHHTNLSFYSNDDPQYPDEIDITIVHDDLNEENRSTIVNGTYLFLDNILGELDFATTIDNLSVVGNTDAERELIPIHKLRDYLIWRQKEFIEKYEGVRRDTENDAHSMFEAELEDGSKLLAMMNTDLLQWDSKASHPWILTVDMNYRDLNPEADEGNDAYDLLDEIEDKVLEQLKDYEGYLYIGRETAGFNRLVYFACKEFRKPSKVLHKIVDDYSNQLDISYDIFKDKYWQSFNRFCST